MFVKIEAKFKGIGWAVSDMVSRLALGVSNIETGKCTSS